MTNEHTSVIIVTKDAAAPDYGSDFPDLTDSFDGMTPVRTEMLMRRDLAVPVAPRPSATLAGTLWAKAEAMALDDFTLSLAAKLLAYREPAVQTSGGGSVSPSSLQRADTGRLVMAVPENELARELGALSANVETLRNDVGSIKQDISGLRADFKEEMQNVRTDFRKDIGWLRTDFKDAIGGMRADLKEAMNEYRTQNTEHGNQLASLGSKVGALLWVLGIAGGVISGLLVIIVKIAVSR